MAQTPDQPIRTTGIEGFLRSIYARLYYNFRILQIRCALRRRGGNPNSLGPRLPIWVW